jgi:hypothetical protein
MLICPERFVCLFNVPTFEPANLSTLLVYPADSTRLNSILFSIFYLPFSAFITPFPSVTY